MTTMSLLCFPMAGRQQMLSPLSYGLLEADNGIERYDILLRCHQEAVKTNCGVDYSGIDTIKLEIPFYADGIPLSDYTDFAGVVIQVNNQAKDVGGLFTMIRVMAPIDLTKQQIDNADFGQESLLMDGDFIVVIEDKTPWVSERKGYGYPHIRQDILYVNNGMGKNRVVMPYDNEWSNPECTYRRVSKKKKMFTNLRFERTKDSSYKTCLLYAKCENGLTVQNVTTVTPVSLKLYGDAIFRIENCTNLTFEDVVIDGTYSSVDKFGYAFNLRNIWNHVARRVKADGNWGVYGTNNMNTTTLEECHLNRFDIHNYGRDVTMRNCHFFKLYNDFGATFGNVAFVNCVFDGSKPYINSGSYNTFVNVNVIFDNCKFYLTDKINYIVQMMSMHVEVNGRPELSAKCIPNISFNNCEVNVPESVNKWYIINAGRYCRDIVVEGGNTIDINTLVVTGNVESIGYLQTDKIELKKPFDIKRNSLIKTTNKRIIETQIVEDWFWPLTRKETAAATVVTLAMVTTIIVCHKRNLS